MSHFIASLQLLEKEREKQTFCILNSIDHLWDKNKKWHVCLACNLDDKMEDIYWFLYDSRLWKDSQIVTTKIFFYLLNCISEDILCHMNVFYNTQDILAEIRVWSNFFKHPYNFSFTHHSKYYTYRQKIPQWDLLVINTEFLKKLQKERKQKWKGTITNTPMNDSLKNAKNVIVHLPNFTSITRRFLKSMVDVTEEVKTNVKLKKQLKNISFIEDYESNNIL